MKFTAMTGSATAATAIAAAALMLPATASAQTAYPAPISDSEIQTLPPEYRTGPAVADYSETITDANGIETITRIRRIESTAPYPAEYNQYETERHVYRHAQPAHAYAHPASVFERDQWIEECERRTSGRSGSEKGGIIGGLLGAIGGGIAGNRIAGSGDRLAGTLIGGGLGGIAGAVLGSLIGGGRNDRGEYDCEAALDGYLTQYGQPGHRFAHRSIPAPAYAPAPHGYGYGYAPAYQYYYQPPQQVVYVPVEYEVPQRVIVRETVREEVIPGATRSIPPAPRPVPVPPREPRYIKGN